ncbi:MULTISPECIES: DDE-type integrase/transposase/recombinase [unclassified Methylobacterium]|jgi:putative transposase|uniref:DDE-type integrase/transposase/recombinase n=1 Tax=unclassified Methylobacterium TaxID=2615210 RepID=UPI0009E71A9F|nr:MULTISPECIES: DDE-type integrase/transposase/recombinase [unclassified Methylobacterium]
MKIPFPNLQLNVRVELYGVSYVFMAREDAGYVFRSSVDGETRTVGAAELQNAFFKRAFKIPPQIHPGLPKGVRERIRYDLNELPDPQQDEAIRRWQYCRALDRLADLRLKAGNRKGRRLFGRSDRKYDQAARIVAMVLRRWGVRDEHNPGGSTLRDWFRRWERSGKKPSALVRLDHLKGRKPTRHVPAVMKIVFDCVRDFYLVRDSTCSVPTLHTHVLDLIDAHNKKFGTNDVAPTVAQLYRIIDQEFDEAEKCYLREGAKVARERFSPKRRRKSPKKLMEIVEIDHALLDIIAVRERTGIPLESEDDAPELKKGIAGRVWVTVAICQASRCVVGRSLSLDPPSYVSVMRCLRNMLSQKADVQLGELTVANPCFGLPKVVHVDNGKDFHSLSLKVAAASLNFEVRHMGRHRPWERGRVERFFREVQQDFAAQPGRTFSSTVDRGDYDSEGNATLTFPVIENMFDKWVAGIHHHRPHRGLFWRTPAEVWDELAQFGVGIPPDVKDIEVLTRKVLHKPVKDSGIEYLGLFWHSDELAGLHRKYGTGRKFPVMIDPLNLLTVEVIEETETETETKVIRHVAEIDDKDLVQGIDLDMWERVRNRGRERTPEGERLRRETMFEARKELMRVARENDLAGEKLTKGEAKFAERAAKEEAQVRKAARLAEEQAGVPPAATMAPKKPTAVLQSSPIATASVAVRSTKYA